jgi:Phytanoyl-CoA dioxygenase (PhyH)
MTDPAEIARELEQTGYAVIPNRMDHKDLAAARADLSELLTSVDWGSGFDGSRTKRVFALLAKTRCMDRAAADRLVLEAVEQVIGPGAQFSLTCATQVHPGQDAQVLHYEQGIYPLPRDRDVMLTAIWALDDFTASNGATLVVPGSHQLATGKPDPGQAVPVEMPRRIFAALLRQALPPRRRQHQHPAPARGHHRLPAAVAAPLRGAHAQHRPRPGPQAAPAASGTTRIQPAFPVPRVHQRPASPSMADERSPRQRPVTTVLDALAHTAWCRRPIRR